VLEAFSKAIYLLTDEDELFWISTTDAPMHQRCVQIASPLPKPLAGAPFQVQGHILMIDSAYAFNMHDSHMWHEPHIDSNLVLELAILSRRVKTFYSNLDVSQPKGFGNFIPNILSFSQNEYINPLPEFGDSILVFAHPLVLEMARACLEHQLSRISKNMDALIGLGAGLTPSGDDFLGGLLFAIRTIQTMYPNAELGHYEIQVDAYNEKTNLISFALLKDLANGQAVAPLHHIINILLSGESLEEINPFVSKLTLVGHSTGWDLLTGLFTGLLITFRNNRFPLHK
jgi:hypothetical protein